MISPSGAAATLASLIGWDDEIPEPPSGNDRREEALVGAASAGSEGAEAAGLLECMRTAMAERSRLRYDQAGAVLQELRGLAARRRELAARVQALVKQRGLVEHVHFRTPNVVRDITEEAPAAQLPDVCEGAKATRWISLSEPVTFALDDEEAPAGSTPGPLASSFCDGDWEAEQLGCGGPGDADDWEHALDALGVARCGVCRMKLPLDVQAIEEHCVECEAKHGICPFAPRG